LSPIPPISTKGAIISDIKQLNIEKTMTYGIGNNGSSLGYAHRYGGVKAGYGFIHPLDDYIWTLNNYNSINRIQLKEVLTYNHFVYIQQVLVCQKRSRK
jgi:hypothetical protein